MAMVPPRNHVHVSVYHAAPARDRCTLGQTCYQTKLLHTGYVRSPAHTILFGVTGFQGVFASGGASGSVIVCRSGRSSRSKITWRPWRDAKPITIGACKFTVVG